MKVARLRDLLQFLQTQTRASFLGPAVDAYFQENEIEFDDWIPFTRFREDTYARNLIYRTDLYELFVLAWLPGQKAGIHDHAGQRCWTSVGCGVLTFQDFAPWAGPDTQPIALSEPVKYEPGQTVYMDDGVGMHSLANLSNKPAVSLHLYAGPITRCRVYDPALRAFKLVDLESFPPPPEMEWSKELPLLLG